MRDVQPQAVLDALDASADRLVTPAGCGQMAWRRWGRGTPLVLLHGGSGSWTHWVRNINALSEEHTLLVPDMPGYGESVDALPAEKDSGGLEASIAAIADPLVEGVSALLPGIPRIDICGFSFGGIIGGLVALALGDRVRNLVVVGSEGLGGRRIPLAPFRSLRGLTGIELKLAARHNLQVLMLASADAVDDLAIQTYLTNLSKTRFRSSKLTSQTDILYQTLVRLNGTRIAGIWGSRDAIAFPYIAEREERLTRIQKGADFRVIDGAGHWVNYEAPEIFNATLLSLIHSDVGISQLEFRR